MPLPAAFGSRERELLFALAHVHGSCSREAFLEKLWPHLGKTEALRLLRETIGRLSEFGDEFTEILRIRQIRSTFEQLDRDGLALVVGTLVVRGHISDAQAILAPFKARIF